MSYRIFGTIITMVLFVSCDSAPKQAAEERLKEAPKEARAETHEIAGNVTSTRIVKADQEPGNWLAHGRTYDEQRFSPLKQINRDTVKTLGLAWEYQTGSKRGLEATPIVVDGTLYTTSTWSEVMALDAKTGELRWRYNPKVERAWAKRLCCDIVNRGVAVWRGTVFVGTLDGYLVALNASSGEVLWRVNTLVDRDKYYSITGAPRVINGNVIIGNGGAEYDVRGYVSAYNSETGELNWRFYTVPGSAEGPFEHTELKQAATTWDKQSNWQGAGGTVWDSMAYDPELDLLYVGTGNGSPWSHYARSPSGGDNLYLSSILALKPDTGRMVWHYQTTPGDSWDFTSTQHMILADLAIDGVNRKVLMQAPKNGFFYVLDRTNGKVISAEKYVFANWASHVDVNTGRPQVTDLGNYRDGAKYVFPSAAGGHNWQPMSYSPDTGLVYVPARESGWVHNEAGDKWFTLGVDNIEELSKGQNIPESAGFLKAWDPVKQKLIWQLETPNIWNGGTLATGGGLVFHGTATGHLLALNDATGELLLDLNIGTGIIAPPIAYEIDGEQVIAVMAGWGGPAFNTLKGDEALLTYKNSGRLLVFRLNGDKVALPSPATTRGEFTNANIKVSEEELERGRMLYVIHCAACHGAYGSTPMLPDLRRLAPEKHTLFNKIVLEGLFEANGMPNFSDDLSLEDANAIHAYVGELSKEAAGGL